MKKNQSIELLEPEVYYILNPGNKNNKLIKVGGSSTEWQDLIKITEIPTRQCFRVWCHLIEKDRGMGIISKTALLTFSVEEWFWIKKNTEVFQLNVTKRDLAMSSLKEMNSCLSHEFKFLDFCRSNSNTETVTDRTMIFSFVLNN